MPQEISHVKVHEIREMKRGLENLHSQVLLIVRDGSKPPGGVVGEWKWLEGKELSREIFWGFGEVEGKELDGEIFVGIPESYWRKRSC